MLEVFAGRVAACGKDPSGIGSTRNLPAAWPVSKDTVVPLLAVPPWTDQELVLYHGTVDMDAASILQAVDLKRCRPLCDFGKGSTPPQNECKPNDGRRSKQGGREPPRPSLNLPSNAMTLPNWIAWFSSARASVLLTSGALCSFAKPMRTTTTGDTNLGMISWPVRYLAIGKSRP